MRGISKAVAKAAAFFIYKAFDRYKAVGRMRTRAKRQNIISNIFLKIPGMSGKRIEFERNIKYNVLVLKIGDKIKRGRYSVKESRGQPKSGALK